MPDNEILNSNLWEAKVATSIKSTNQTFLSREDRVKKVSSPERISTVLIQPLRDFDPF